jgi:hypothetical protein
MKTRKKLQERLEIIRKIVDFVMIFIRIYVVKTNKIEIEHINISN